jgi:hypothetical protein
MNEHVYIYVMCICNVFEHIHIWGGIGWMDLATFFNIKWMRSVKRGILMPIKFEQEKEIKNGKRVGAKRGDPGKL